MSLNGRPASASISFSIDQIPVAGMRIDVCESIDEVLTANGSSDKNLKNAYQQPIVGGLEVFRVGSKVDIRGQLSTQVAGVCDFCASEVQLPVDLDFNLFLMPADQFSEHDKPGGKPVFSKTASSGQNLNKRARKKKKQSIQSSRPGEHEDASFGAFDGLRVNLYPHLQESLILQFPMNFQCEHGCSEEGRERLQKQQAADSKMGGLSDKLSAALRSSID